MKTIQKRQVKPADTKATKPLAYVLTTREERPVSLSLVIRNRPLTLAADHVNFKPVLAELKQPAPNQDKIMSLIDATESLLEFSNKSVVVKGGRVYFKGNQIGGTVVSRILEFMKNGLPYEPLLNFLQNLPGTEHGRDSLYKFLENEGLTLTADGCLLGYKGVGSDYCSSNVNNLPSFKGVLVNKDGGKYIRFAPGDKGRCNPEDVENDPTSHCARGIHVGSHNYAKGYGGGDGHMVLLKINPKDVISVPNDTREKMRVCAFEVLCDLANPEDTRYGTQLKGSLSNAKKIKNKSTVLLKRAAKKRRVEAKSKTKNSKKLLKLKRARARSAASKKRY